MSSYISPFISSIYPLLQVQLQLQQQLQLQLQLRLQLQLQLQLQLIILHSCFEPRTGRNRGRATASSGQVKGASWRRATLPYAL